MVGQLGVGRALVCLNSVIQVCGANFFHISYAIKMKCDMCHPQNRPIDAGIVCELCALCVKAAVGVYKVTFSEKP